VRRAILLALLVMTSATCGEDKAAPVAGPAELLIRSSGNPGQQVILVASARNLGGLPVRYRGERCSSRDLRHIDLWIKSPSGDMMYLGDPLMELHGCSPTLEFLPPGAAVERIVTLDGYLYASDSSGRVRMPPGRYTVTFFFTWILDDYGAQLRIVEQPVAVDWPAQ